MNIRIPVCKIVGPAAAGPAGPVRNDNNNNNNSHDNVYGAVIMTKTKVIARVHPVHLMNVD